MASWKWWCFWCPFQPGLFYDWKQATLSMDTRALAPVMLLCVGYLPAGLPLEKAFPVWHGGSWRGAGLGSLWLCWGQRCHFTSPPSQEGEGGSKVWVPGLHPAVPLPPALMLLCSVHLSTSRCSVTIQIMAKRLQIQSVVAWVPLCVLKGLTHPLEQKHGAGPHRLPIWWAWLSSLWKRAVTHCNTQPCRWLLESTWTISSTEQVQYSCRCEQGPRMWSTEEQYKLFWCYICKFLSPFKSRQHTQMLQHCALEENTLGSSHFPALDREQNLRLSFETIHRYYHLLGIISRMKRVTIFFP